MYILLCQVCRYFFEVLLVGFANGIKAGGIHKDDFDSIVCPDDVLHPLCFALSDLGGAAH